MTNSIEGDAKLAILVLGEIIVLVIFYLKATGMIV